MNATEKSLDTKQVRPPGKAEPLETLKALVRLLERQAAAGAFTRNQSTGSNQ